MTNFVLPSLKSTALLTRDGQFAAKNSLMDLTPDVTRASAPHGLATMADQELQRVLEALQQREKEVEKLRTQLKEVR